MIEVNKKYEYLSNPKWEKKPMKDLSRFDKIVLDTETTGLQAWEGDRTIGVAVGAVRDDGKIASAYYPYGHPSGSQYGRDEVIDWLRRELHNKTLIFHHYNFDALMLYQDGLDVRQHGNKMRDTQFGNALLRPDSSSSLDDIARFYYGPNYQKIKCPFPPEDFQHVPSNALADYAEHDVFLTGMVDQKQQQEIDKFDLRTVYELECELAPAIMEMELNGLRIDVEKLERWIPEVQKEYEIAMEALAGINPNSGKQLAPKFDDLGIAYPYNFECPECNDSFSAFAPQECVRCREPLLPKSPHFGNKLLKKIEHPFAQKVVRAKLYRRLLNTFLLPWQQTVKDGVLRFNLNQLMERDGGFQRGTISGRLSANMPSGGAQPQQIWNPDSQREEFDGNFILRELFIPEPGSRMFRIDASQIEYRLFAHYSNSDKLLDAYRNNPNIDFHQTVADVILQGKMGTGKAGRKKAKNINFGKLYGMGHGKFSREVGVSRAEGYEMYKFYDDMFPQAKEIISRYSNLARSKGEIRTLLGRRFTFPHGKPTYVALNRLIQGSAADVMKSMLVRTYREKLISKMRLTVHDELMGDIVNEKQALACKEAAQEDLQHLIKVPVLWDMEVGANWAMT